MFQFLSTNGFGSHQYLDVEVEDLALNHSTVSGANYRYRYRYSRIFKPANLLVNN